MRLRLRFSKQPYYVIYVLIQSEIRNLYWRLPLVSKFELSVGGTVLETLTQVGDMPETTILTESPMVRLVLSWTILTPGSLRTIEGICEYRSTEALYFADWNVLGNRYQSQSSVMQGLHLHYRCSLNIIFFISH